jgi:hypothetical protein
MAKALPFAALWFIAGTILLIISRKNEMQMRITGTQIAYNFISLFRSISISVLPAYANTMVM